MNITSIIEPRPIELPQDNIYYLPSALTALQKSLIQILLELHSASLSKILESGEEPEVVDLEAETLSDKEMLHLLAQNWQNVISHPFLLVDHYIPKNLILMESSPNLIRDSGKFKQFDDLINKLENIPHNVVVVAKTIKEIDLIESYLLGRKLNYKRYTGASLYDINASQESSSRASGSTTNNSNGGHRRATDEYFPRISKNAPEVQYFQRNPKNKLTVHLISSNQIQTMYFNENLNFNLIISFDPTLSGLTYLRQIKSADARLVPMVKLVVFNSIERSTILGEKDTKRNVLQAIAEMNSDYEVCVDPKWLEDYSKVQWPVELGNLREFTKEDVLNSLNNALKGETAAAKKIKQEPIKANLSTSEYKQHLTRLIKDKISEVSEAAVKTNRDLDPKRAKESAIQVSIETKNFQIAEFVKLKQSLEVELGALTRRVEKLDSDLLKIENSKAIKKELLTKEDLEEIEVDETELESLSKLNEEIRTEYQLNSSNAADASMRLTLMTNENNELKAKLDDSNQALIRDQLEKINHARQKYATEKLARRNDFLASYNYKINNIISNNNIMDSNSSRNTNGRLSRSSTPRI